MINSKESNINHAKFFSLVTNGEYASINLQNHVENNISFLYGMIGDLSLASLNIHKDFKMREYKPEALDEDQSEQLEDLRDLFPEFSMLSDNRLHSLYDNFMTDCFCQSGWDANRHEEVLLYALGKLMENYVNRKFGRIQLPELGIIIGYALMCGASIEAALAITRNWMVDNELFELA